MFTQFDQFEVKPCSRGQGNRNVIIDSTAMRSPFRTLFYCACLVRWTNRFQLSVCAISNVSSQPVTRIPSLSRLIRERVKTEYVYLSIPASHYHPPSHPNWFNMADAPKETKPAKKRRSTVRSRSKKPSGEDKKKEKFLRAEKDDVAIEDGLVAAAVTNKKASNGPSPLGPVASDVDQSIAVQKKGEQHVKWCNQILAKSNRRITKEFTENKNIKPAQYTTEVYEKNEPKNRYNDISCIDATRVILKERGPEEDYIHGNWMTMPDGQKYICTQGPLPETLEDFWHMLYTEKSNIVIQLCNQFEGKNEKCSRYWPKPKGPSIEEFGPYKVSVKEKKGDPFEGVTYQVLECDAGSGKTSLLVHHFATATWPDHTAPESPAAMAGLLKLSRKLASGAPICVHCSAGIGRTSTFVGIDLATQRIRVDGEASMVEVLRELRTQRFHSIQSAIQYLFMHMCILEGFAEEGAIPRKGKYQSYLESYVVLVKKYAARIQNVEKEKEKEEKKE